MDRRVVILQSAGRVAAMAAGAVLVAAVGTWLASVGLAILTLIPAWGGAIALSLLMARLWNAHGLAVWLLALVFGATALLPASALGQDAVLAAYGHQEQAWVTGYQEVSAGHMSSSTYTVLRTRSGQHLEVLGKITTDLDKPRYLQVDPDRRVRPQLASDVDVRWDLGWTIAGLTAVLVTVLGYGIRGERGRLHRPVTRDVPKKRSRR